MASQTINGTVLLRNDTAANWATKNPTMGKGEIGIASDISKIKIGDGLTAWNSLSYLGSPVSACTAGDYYAVNTEISASVALSNYNKLHFVCGDDTSTEGVQTITVLLNDGRTYHKLAWNVGITTAYATVDSLAKSNKYLTITVNKTTNKITIVASNVTSKGIRQIYAE